MNASACAGVSIWRDIVLYGAQFMAPDVVDAMPEVTMRSSAIQTTLQRAVPAGSATPWSAR